MAKTKIAALRCFPFFPAIGLHITVLYIILGGYARFWLASQTRFCRKRSDLLSLVEITLIPKPGKPHQDTASYRPISLLAVLSKIFERILLVRLLPVLEDGNLSPAHQLCFRSHHGMPEQCHRVVDTILNSFKCRK